VYLSMEEGACGKMLTEKQSQVESRFKIKCFSLPHAHTVQPVGSLLLFFRMRQYINEGLFPGRCPK
jgi:hypothetical protein